MLKTNSVDAPEAEATVRAIGEDLLNRMAEHPAPGLLSKSGAYARIMQWAMRDPAFKAQLFRFVDVLPVLRSSAEIVGHLREYLGDHAVVLHPALKAGLGAAGFAPKLVAGPVKAQVTDMARQFVAGETPRDLVKRIRSNTKRGIATTIDLLGETVVSEAEADVFLQRNLEVLTEVSAAMEKDGEGGFSDATSRGPLPRLNLSVKISALTPEVNPADPATSLRALKERLRPLLRRAIEVGAFINFDMESYKLKDLTFALFRSILEEAEFREQPAMGIALQAYLRSADADLDALIQWVRQQGRPITVRLVKGAYWDFETVLAEQRGWPVPVWSQKAQSDACFERLSTRLLEEHEWITAAFASHNVRSCAHAIAQAERLGLDPRDYEFQALYGMADDLKAALAATGHRVREYCPIGELLPGMAYLVRRLLENTSNEGFLSSAASGEVSAATLLRDPAADVTAEPAPPAATGFVNAPNRDFSQTAERERLAQAIEDVRAKLGQERPPIVGGRAIAPREWLESRNPADPAQVLGRWGVATIADADQAVAAAQKAWPQWRRTPVAERAGMLDRAADLMEARRSELTALIILEAGKPWPEADADVSEAVDFCRFYAAEMRRIDAPVLTQRVAGERNTTTWTARGVGVAIAPWNFPLAILTGLTVAPLVGGNAVIMKPAEQTTLIAGVCYDILREAGVPAEVLHFLPGRGEEIGAHLVAHPQISFVAFTGSRAVGTAIWEAAGRTLPGQTQLKKVVCEMGGKNALIIDDDADLDEAIPGALYSAFGFSGQKCSALSRLIVLDGIYDTFVERFVAACGSLQIGDPTDPGTLVGPVIDEEAQRKIRGCIDTGRGEARLAYQGTAPAHGWFIGPTVFTEVRPDHRIAQDEVFGPVVAILRARDLDEAIAWANGTDYALTAGLFSRRPSALRRAAAELEAGNIYLNRAITGAIVERQPFGGYRMSGGGTKAGGRGYLENFLVPRLVSENVLRRGFTPPDE
ncbi:proline dehydrogenase family protein [Actomonas aquatica]|uniref:L-glutamate gamma-semialdehyde dehydrogenase n=1 Tax=Actomonas aquatica TaxID=2866162 RepID=A0ABZ1CBA1_9BACT|nr:proline dehydrogenase family protein [Opitutus sp. WL0086]WRQ88961.1 proline dehydrogenase family protein [Opitutus sp. WL0086]